jgi:hypothetical protein
MASGFVVFLEPWFQLSAESATFFEEELTREVAPSHPLYGRKCTAIAKTGASDDVLFSLEDGTFAQVHLTHAQYPERRGWPRHRTFDSIASWMVAIMIEDHIDHAGLW